MENRRITKEEAIRNHRKMWSWIADQYKSGRRDYVNDLKREYIDTYFPGEHILCNCFCCEYVDKNGGSCRACPVIWYENETNSCIAIGGMYNELLYFNSYMSTEKLEELARHIANLPEREREGICINSIHTGQIN